MPATADFTFQRGEDVAITWTIKESAAGAARDITGWTFALGLKRYRHEASPLHEMDWEITNAGNGTVRTTLANEISETLEGDYVYSLWRTDDGFASCQARGTITFEL